MSIFVGCATALVTPFSGDAVDFNAYERLIDYQLQNKVDALVVLGTTSESPTLLEKEKLDILDFTIEKVDGRVPIIVGTGSNSTREAQRFSKIVSKRKGVDSILVVTPFYNKCTQEGLIKHYYEVADASEKPVYCYNVPSRTAVNILPKTFLEISKHPNICGIKEASGNIPQIEEEIALVGREKDIISGDDALTTPLIFKGAKGVISVISNLFPKYVLEMTHLALSEDKEAERMQEKINPLVSALFSEPNPTPIKYALSKYGFCDNTLRLPLLPMSEEKSTILDSLLIDFIS